MDLPTFLDASPGASGECNLEELIPVLTPVLQHPAGQPEGFAVGNLPESQDGMLRIYTLRTGGSYPMHDTAAPIYVAILRGAGVLEFSGQRLVKYRGGDVFLFKPGSPHSWHSVTEDTVMLGISPPQAGPAS